MKKREGKSVIMAPPGPLISEQMRIQSKRWRATPRIADCKSFTNGDAVDFMVYQNLLIFIGPLVFVLRWCTIGPKIKDVPQDDEDTG